MSAPTTEVWGWSDCGHPESWQGSARTREEAIEKARAEYGERQSVVWIQRGIRYPASHYVPDSDDVLEFILERMWLSAKDEAPCDASDEWPDVEARKALGRTLDYMMEHVDKWADKHCSPLFWVAVGEPHDPIADLFGSAENDGAPFLGRHRRVDHRQIDHLGLVGVAAIGMGKRQGDEFTAWIDTIRGHRG